MWDGIVYRMDRACFKRDNDITHWLLLIAKIEVLLTSTSSNIINTGFWASSWNKNIRRCTFIILCCLLLQLWRQSPECHPYLSTKRRTLSRENSALYGTTMECGYRFEALEKHNIDETHAAKGRPDWNIDPWTREELYRQVQESNALKPTSHVSRKARKVQIDYNMGYPNTRLKSFIEPLICNSRDQ